MRLRAFAYPAQLALARLRAGAGRRALVAAGIALGGASLALVLAGSLLARDRAVGDAIGTIPGPQRAVRATWGGFPEQAGEVRSSVDRSIRGILAPLAGEPVVSSVIFREMRVGGALVDVGALDGLERWIALRSGRLPTPCRPSRCEVIQVGGSGPLPGGIGLVRVGSGSIRSAVPFGGAYQTASQEGVVVSALEYHTPLQAPILLAEGVAGASAFPAFESVLRTYVWSVPLQRSSVHLWDVDQLLASVARATAAVEAVSEAAQLSAPVEEVRAARNTGRVGARRLLLIGGEVAALVLAFALLAAASPGREIEAASRRLTWFGARSWQRLGVFSAEAVVIALAGVLAGWLAGAAISAVVADRAGAPVWPALTHSTFSGTGIWTAAGVWAATTLMLLASWRAGRQSLRSARLTVLDVAALGALVAIVVGVARGAADAQALTEQEGTGVFLLLLPALVTLVAAVACVRVLPLALRGLERVTRTAAPPLRLAALSLGRNPGRTAVAVAFLVVSLSLAVFAATYRSTLSANQAAQASYAVPLDFKLEEGYPVLAEPLEVASLSDYRSLAPGTLAYPVFRGFGSASGAADQAGTTVLGVPAEAMPRLRGWRSDFSALSPQEIERRIAAPAPIGLRGIELPADASELVLPVRNDGPGIQLSAAVRTRAGGLSLLRLGRLRRETRELAVRLPKRARGGTLASFVFDLSTAGTRAHGHVGSDSGFLEEERGTLTLGRLRARVPAGTVTLGGYEDWTGVHGIRRARGSPLRLRYLVSGQETSRFRARQSTDGRPVPVVASPDLAAAAGPDGVIPIRFVDQQLDARVVGTARRFPTVTGSFVLADQDWLSTALDADVLGSGSPSEVWLGGSRTKLAEALSQRPYDRLQITSRASLLDGLRAEPIARGSLITLGAAALVALLLALAGLLLALANDLRDERGELRDLEAEGVGPSALRRHLRLRSLIALGFGLAGGLGTGAVLAALVVGIVKVTAGTAEPVPPLVLAVDWWVLAAGLLGLVGVVLLLVELVTRRAFRAPVAHPAEVRL